MNDYKIVDNFLSPEKFGQLKNILESETFAWYLIKNVGGPYDTSDIYFIHTFFNGYAPQSNLFNTVFGIFRDKLEPKSIIRLRANLYPQKETLIEHEKHTDFGFSHKSMVFYVNTNDGFTRLADGTKVMSVENRALLFDAGSLHNSTNCTDQKSRMVLTINYF